MGGVCWEVIVTRRGSVFIVIKDAFAFFIYGCGCSDDITFECGKPSE